MAASIQQQFETFLQLFGENRWAQAAVILAVALVVAKVVDWVVTRGFKVWARSTRTDLDDRLADLLHKPVFVSVVLFGLYLVVQRVAPPEAVDRFLVRSLKTIAIFLWLGFGIRGASAVLDTLSRIEHRFALFNQRTVTLLQNLMKIALVGGGIYAGFLVWGIDVGALLLSAGVLGIAVGFAAKDTLANFFAGIFILADAPYKIGDFIILDSGERGEVTQIGLRSTRMLTRDDIEITVPNAVIGNAKITNETGGPWEKERLRARVGVAYGSDVDEVRRVLLGIAAAEPHLVGDPEPRVRFRGFGDSSLDFELLGWVDEPVLRGRVLDSIYTAIYKQFGTEGIEIPFPQRDIHLHRAGDDG